MKHEIIFNQNTSVCAEGEQRFNEMFVKQRTVFIGDMLMVRGYLYLNQVYEILGIKWNPESENVCYIYDKENLVKFDSYACNEGIVFTITW